MLEAERNSIWKTSHKLFAKIKKRYGIILLILLTIMLYLFWGPLFPWNPLKTGFKATLTIRMIANGLYTSKGISPPEYMGKHQACIDYLQKGLRKRNVNWEISEQKL